MPFDPRNINRFPGILAGGLAKIVPTWPVELNRSNSLARGMIAGFIPAMGGNPRVNDISGVCPPLAQYRYITGGGITNSFTPTPVGIGVAGTVSGTSGNGEFITNLYGLPSFNIQSQLTLVCVGWSSSTSSSDDNLFGIYSSLSSNLVNNWFGIRGVGNNTWGNTDFTGGASQSVAMTANYFAVASTWQLGTGAAANLYLNGKLINNRSISSSSFPTYTNPQYLQIGSALNSTSQRVLTAGFVFNRILSLSEIAEISAAPFGMLRPVIRRQYYGAASRIYGAPSWQLDLT